MANGRDHLPLKSSGPERRGSSLASAMVMIGICASVVVGIGGVIQSTMRIQRRKAELSRAFYAADAGTAIVEDWGNFPASFSPDPTLFKRVDPAVPAGTTATLVNISANPATLFPTLAAALGAGGIDVTHAQLDAMGAGSFTSMHGDSVATIDSIQIQSPDASDPVSSFFKVITVGKSTMGVKRKVTAWMNIGPIMSLRLPAALISHNVASAFGNARVHWGEAWSKSDFSMLANSQMDYLIPGNSDYDPHVRYLTEGTINFPSNWRWGAGRDLYDASRTDPGAAPASGNYANVFRQHLPAGTLSWPDFEYQSFKDLAKAHGRYYGTDSSGSIYRDGIKTASNQVDFLAEFGVADRSAAPYDLVFIDTINGQPPAADGSNLATISASGNSLGLKGVFWIGANFDGGGVGSPPSDAATDPDGNAVSLDKIFLDGVMYSAGTLALSGNAGVYGSIVTNRGFTGGGTPDVYYNAKLADGLILGDGNVGSMFQVALQSNS